MKSKYKFYELLLYRYALKQHNECIWNYYELDNLRTIVHHTTEAYCSFGFFPTFFLFYYEHSDDTKT